VLHPASRSPWPATPAMPIGSKQTWDLGGPVRIGYVEL